jgi:hypothetical protein
MMFVTVPTRYAEPSFGLCFPSVLSIWSQPAVVCDVIIVVAEFLVRLSIWSQPAEVCGMGAWLATLVRGQWRPVVLVASCQRRDYAARERRAPYLDGSGGQCD